MEDIYWEALLIGLILASPVVWIPLAIFRTERVVDGQGKEFIKVEFGLKPPVFVCAIVLTSWGLDLVFQVF